MSRMLCLLGLACTLVVAAGCGSGPRYVPVSGRVTMDGKPLKGVMVLFQPVAAQGVDAGGAGSTAMTDADGRYTLEASTADPTRGALVGKHTVRIATPPPKGADDSDAATSTRGKVFTDPIPARYNVASQLTFEVPPGGTDKADFELQSK